MNPIVQLIITEAPAIIALIRDRHKATDPNAPVLTNEQVLAAFEEAFGSSLTKDAMLRAALEAEIAGK